ncbi:MAG: rRNA maturation RNase YbeY [Salinivirgaceae bacterium]
MIHFFEEDISRPKLDYDSISIWVQSVVESKGFVLADVSYIFCSDEYLYKLNKEYLNHVYYTDIITFNYNDEKFISGDLFISVDRVLENAKNLEIENNQEFLRVMIHGILHLLGYDDKFNEEQKTMRLEENKYIHLFLNAKNV